MAESPPPEARAFPSGAKARAVTPLWCPRNWATCRPVAVSQTRTVFCSGVEAPVMFIEEPPDARKRPVGENATTISDPGLLNLWMRVRVARSQTETQDSW